MKTDPVLPVGLEALPARWTEFMGQAKAEGQHDRAFAYAVCILELEAVLSAEPRQQDIYPIPLTSTHEQSIKEWAADDRLWTTQETVEFNLRTFARTILKDATEPRPPAAAVDRLTERETNLVCGVIVSSQLDHATKEKLCGKVRAALAAPREETEQADGSRI